MSISEHQQREIETIRERTIKVKLSDADCSCLMDWCGMNNLTVGELIGNFVSDLTGGTCSNGGDEQRCANEWFERCWSEMVSEQTLLSHLLCAGYDPEDYLEYWDNIESAKEDKAYLAEHPHEANEEAQFIDDSIAEWEEDLKNMRIGWQPENVPNMDEEVAALREWLAEKEALKG